MHAAHASLGATAADFTLKAADFTLKALAFTAIILKAADFTLKAVAFTVSLFLLQILPESLSLALHTLVSCPTHAPASPERKSSLTLLRPLTNPP